MDQSLLHLMDDETFNRRSLILNDSASEEPKNFIPKSKTVSLKPGFCLKTKTDGGEKVFINICKGDDLPEVKDITDEELLRVIEEQDPTGFRIPLSIGQPHAEVDKNGKGCTAYDVVVNTNFLDRLHSREILMGFFTTIVLEGIEYKYDSNLNREWVILKNKKYLGTMPEHHIRTESKPLIMEMDQNSNKVADVVEKKNLKSCEPAYTILQEPPVGHPEYLVAELYLSKIKNTSSMTLDLGEDRILLQTRSNVYYLDIYLPYNIITEDCGAQFDKMSKILTVTMPVQA